MDERPAPAPPAPGPAPLDRRFVVAGGLVLAALAGLAVWLLAITALAPDTRFVVRDAPALELTDQTGQPFSLTSLRGHPVLVFFGYTHCPDVCPATIGTLNQVLADAGDGPRAVFISIDPERDQPPEMATYLKYLPKAYTGLSGTPDQVAANAQRWGVKYAKVDEGSADGYAMAHTADVFLVDAQGRLRGRYPFGTEPGPITAAVKGLLAETPVAAGPITSEPASTPAATAPPSLAPATPPPSAPPSPVAPTPSIAPSAGSSGTPATGDLRVLLVSTSVWAGPQTPVIVTLSEPDGTPLDGAVPVSARVVGANETATAPDVRATTILPTGASRASYVATVQIPAAGWWRLDLLTPDGRKGSVAVEALDPGSTTPIGAPAPDVDTPTLADVGGDLLSLTTQEAPDPRFYQESTADARAAGRPYVLVIDSSRFRVSPACGRALTMTRYLIDRWGDNVAFIHLEPFVYKVVTAAPVLSGDISNPPLNQWTAAWGLGDSVWPATDMPWIFVVDGSGIVRAKYRSIVGTADIDVMLSLIEGRGVQ
ncbi:MAG TPA: SCO family protein [Candidatus Limnocylindrales bacterium]|nr:SCO family protein [Candidatus Limnocylindrales bacterium]